MAELAPNEPKTASEDWTEIESYFPTVNAMKPNKAWVNWMSTRVGTGRLKQLFANRGAGRLAAKLDQMDGERVKAMRTYAAINFEQATYGFRYTLVANVTAPVLFLTVLNLLLPGGIAGMLVLSYGDEKLATLSFFIGFMFTFFVLVLMLSYSLAALNQARDIRHLIDLHAADRGIFFGLEDADDLHSP